MDLWTRRLHKTDSNEELLARCRDGEEDAWIALVRRYERLVYSVPIKEGLTRDAAADVAQHTFTVLFRSLGAIRDPSRLSFWLMTVARREVWRTRRSGDRIQLQAEPPDGFECDHADTHAEIAWVYDAVQKLDEPCRAIVTALFLDPDEPSYEEIGAGLCRPVGSIGPMRARCLDRLREALEGDLDESE